MTALTTRDTLAEHEPVVGAMYLPGSGPRGSIVGCSCLNARDYAAAGHKAGWNGWLSHLFASGAVIDAATLADDEALVNGARAGIAARLTWASMHWGTEDVHPDAWPHIAKAAAAGLAAALTERAS